MKWIRRIAGLIFAIAALLIGLVFYAQNAAVERAKRRIDVKVSPVAFVDDAAAFERGKYLYESRGCAECHGLDGAGRTLVDDGKGTKLAGPNITRGNARLAGYQPIDWVRSIRHGLAPDGRVLRLMPSEDYSRLTDADLAAVVAWARQFPAKTGNTEASLQFPLPAVVAYGLGAIPDAADKIDHGLAAPTPTPEGVTVEHGRYVAYMCTGCHGSQFKGGKVPGGPPDWPAAANLSPGEGSAMVRYPNPEAFISMLKSGKRPDGTPIVVMPFEALGRMNETDARALHLFLKSLPVS
jgi:cytochrome c553